MKKLGLFALLAVLGAGGLPLPAPAQETCRIERVTYRVENLQLVSYIMKPALEGRFPVVVWSHGAKFAAAATPIITTNSPCHPFVTGKGWMIFYTQTRGYGGSEGPAPQATFQRDPLAFLHGRADDINASVEWLSTRPDVNASCVVNTGFSQGAAVVLMASGKQPALYRATVAHAPVVLGPNDNHFVGLAEVIRAGKNISGPILIQSNTTDEDSFLEVTRVLVREFRRWGRSVELREYTHPVGHQFLNLTGRLEFFQIWGGDTRAFVERTFAGCSSGERR